MTPRVPSPLEYELLSLIDTERTGLQVADDYEQAIGRKLNMGSMYVAFRRLREEGWVTTRDGVDEDGRLRYFRITALGAEARSAAAERFARLSGLRGRMSQ